MNVLALPNPDLPMKKAVHWMSVNGLELVFGGDRWI